MDLDDVITKIDENLQYSSMPKRVKNTLKRVSEELKKKDLDFAVKITTGIYEIEEVANDINLPMHAKTMLWDIISDLEALKKTGK